MSAHSAATAASSHTHLADDNTRAHNIRFVNQHSSMRESIYQACEMLSGLVPPERVLLLCSRSYPPYRALR